MSIKLYKQKNTDGLNIMAVLDNEHAFLLSDSYHFILSWINYRTLKSSDEEIALYSIIFNKKLKRFITSKVIKGILQYKILNIATIFGFEISEATILKTNYKKIKQLYKELLENNIITKLSLKEKIIVYLFI